MNKKNRRPDREIVRDALERAHAGIEPDTARLLEAVPAMMAEAARRRRLTSPMEGAVAIGRRAVPVLAAATVILLAAATLLFYGAAGESSVVAMDDRQSIERFILTGSAGDGGEEDLLLQALVQGDNGNG